MNWSDYLLLAVPVLPLLLAFPVLRQFIPGFQYLAIAPASVWLFLSDGQVVELPWLLLGTVFVSSSETQLLLLLAVMLWVPAMIILSTTISANDDSYISNRHYTFYLLTLGGYLGTILAADVVAFFAFSTLTGYGFYGLLGNGEDNAEKRARRVYLYSIIAADLLLFEALLIIASVTEKLDYNAAREAIAGSSLSQLYVAIVFLGFSLKAGFWPLHFWLLLAFRSARPPAVILLVGVPVTIGLLGIVRWLPVGDVTLTAAGVIIQALGGIALLYAIFSALIRRQLKAFSAYVTIFVTGLFCIALGTGLRDPAVWNQYAYLIPVYIIFLGVVLALLTLGIHRYEARNGSQSNQQKQTDQISRWFEGWSSFIVHQCNVIGLEFLPRLRISFSMTIESIVQIDAWKKALQTGEYILQNWSLAVTLFLLLVITIALIAISLLIF